MCKVWILEFGGFWILGILDFGFWGSWILDFGLGILDGHLVTKFWMLHKKRRLCTPNRVGGFGFNWFANNPLEPGDCRKNWNTNRWWSWQSCASKSRRLGLVKSCRTWWQASLRHPWPPTRNCRREKQTRGGRVCADWTLDTFVVVYV